VFNDLEAHKLIGGTVVSGGGGEGAWQRPSDWLEMPVVANTEQKFVGLFPVYDYGGNYVALYFQGDYTVDWGDGNVSSHNSGNKAQHSYVYDDISSNTESTRGYRQVLITVTPDGSDNLTYMDLSIKHDNVRQYSSVDWLDLIISLPEAESGKSIFIGADTYGGLNEVFSTKVEKISLLNTGNMTDFSGFFAQDWDSQLASISIDTISSSISSVSRMFSFCTKLTTVPLFDTSLVPNMGYMFGYCTKLTTVPLFNTSSVTNMSYMFNNCTKLTTVPLFNTTSVTNMSGMFYSCWALTEVPEFNISSVTNISYMFSDCTALTTAPDFDTSSVIIMQGMFMACRNLDTVLNYNISSVNDMSNMFYSCNKLTEVPEFDVSSVTNMSYIFYNCPSLQTARLNGTQLNINYSYCYLSASALNDIFNGLATVDPARNIDITANPGTATCNISIATSKGWTVIS
jgi:surface protein